MGKQTSVWKHGQDKWILERVVGDRGDWWQISDMAAGSQESNTWVCPSPDEGEWGLTEDEAVKIVGKKRNWSAPGPDKLVNYWWKKAEVLHNGVTTSFIAISMAQTDFPIWFAGAKHHWCPNRENFQAIIKADNMPQHNIQVVYCMPVGSNG